MDRKMEFYFTTVEEFASLREYVKSGLERLMAKQDLLLFVALNEAVNNALAYGSCSSFEKLRLRISACGKSRIVIRIKDSGRGFAACQLLKQLKNRFTSDEQLLQESGRGVYIMQYAADHLFFNRAGNEVMLVKRLASADKRGETVV